MEEYDKRSKNSVRPLIRRAGSWTRVPLLMMEFAKSEGLEGEFKDVLDIIAAHYQLARARNRTSGQQKTCFCDRELWWPSPCMESRCLIPR